MGKASRRKTAAREERILRSVEIPNLRYDLRRPCSDCPFRADAAYHPGIFGSIPEYGERAKERTLAHTCHKTDARADCAPENRAPSNAPIQHCAGWALMSREIDAIPAYLTAAMLTGRFNPLKMDDKTVPVFKSFGHMALHYLRAGAAVDPKIAAAYTKLGEPVWPPA